MFCPKCGKEQLSSANFCRGCGANLGILVVRRSGSMSDIESRTLLVIENAVCQQIPMNLSIGDLYITDDGITFMSYATAQKTDTVGGLVAGATGYLGAKAGDRQSLKEAKQTAASKRGEAYGSTIAERRKRYKDSFFLARADISHLKCKATEGKIICTLRSGREREFFVPEAGKYESELANYPSGHVLYDAKLDPHGILLELPSPQALLRMITADTSAVARIAERGIGRMAADDKYMLAFYSGFMKEPETTRKSIAEKAAEMPPAFAASLANRMEENMRKTRRSLPGCVLIGLVVSLAIGGFGIVLLRGALDAVGKDFAYLFLAAAIVGIVMCPVVIIWNLNKIKHIKQLLSILQPLTT